jgi:cyclic pyranopterin monophosphate synthase
MVDVSHKPESTRRAVAEARVEFPPGLLGPILADGGPKGAITEVARIAGIQAAKQTGHLIPLCHPLGLDWVEIRFEKEGDDVLRVECEAACQGRTGVEMEAMTGAALAALTIYDMTKALNKGIRLSGVQLLEKSGGKSGHWTR